ncbi:flagellar motor protein [Calorimonas adulescens]|jgi:MotA/TolQ/ExbB proton channel family.|uniref:Flagellar motor protein n=1 Tax=Calorimonas adulescens TaxID=2606906 RepID=A0A5D8QJ89_9THEO|nr:flagellar motor protein [Calorimonas adulescens]TZE83348.1 flagellar motor protein [Calorimonas adulescens]
MDIASFIGIISGVALIIISILLNGSLTTYIDVPSLMITIGGTIASTLISYPLSKVLDSFKVMKFIFFNKPVNNSEVIKQIVSLANTARREGLLALEDIAENLEDPYLKKGILLVVDGTDPELIRNIMETELDFLEDRHKQSQGVFETFATFAPAFGMIGTLIGLINMLKNLNDPSKVGPGMAVALITTFYGSLMAYLVFLPMARKLSYLTKQETLQKELMLEGILSIQSGENPRIIEEKLKAFLSPKVRELYDRATSQAGEGELNVTKG